VQAGHSTVRCWALWLNTINYTGLLHLLAMTSLRKHELQDNNTHGRRMCLSVDMCSVFQTRGSACAATAQCSKTKHTSVSTSFCT
jgi:hypothetical protein